MMKVELRHGGMFGYINPRVILVECRQVKGKGRWSGKVGGRLL